ncbi:hypothetical protein Tco_0407285 [Tanacetum coccineum]
MMSKLEVCLLMALPNEHQLTFSQYPDAKSMFAAIETRFGGNAATKKTQKTLLKQQYENFSATSAESLDSIFNRLQKIVSRLAILGVVIAQEDLNSKFLSSLPPEWNTHVVVWMNKPEVETMSIDDLYNNFKIVEQKVKKSVGGSSGAQNLAFMTAPSTNSTNDTNTASPQVSTASPNVNAASPQVSTASVSDNTVYAFMVENPNGSNVLHQDLEQIHEDDLEAMDLKWQLSLLSVRAKKYYQRTGKKIFINANDIARYDKSKSDMAEEQVQTNMALMAFSDSEVYTDKTCSKTCLKNYETLKKQCDDLLVKLNESEFKATTYKRGLATLEDQIITYKKNEVLFSEEIGVLKRDVACKDYEINVLKSEFEKVKQEKDGIDFKIEKFDKASKDLDQLLGSQITDKCKKGLGYSAVPPPHPLIYNRPNKLDLSYSGLDEFKEPEFKDNSKENSEESLVAEQVSQDTSSFVESTPKVDKETVFPVNKKVEFTKPKNHGKPVKKSVRLALYVEVLIICYERNPDILLLVAIFSPPDSASFIILILHHNKQSLSQHQILPYQTSQFITPYQHQSTPLSTTYPTNEYQSTVHHNVYSQQPSIPQLEYAPTTYQQQQPEFSQPDSNLVVPVFQKGDDPIDAINHMMSFLTAVVTSRRMKTSYAAENIKKFHTWCKRWHCFKQRKEISILAEIQGSLMVKKLSEIITHNAAYHDDEWIQMHSLSGALANSVNKALTTELDRYKEEVKELKEKQNVENSFSGPNEQSAEIAHLKQNLFEQGQEKDSLMKTVSELKNKLQLEENRNIEREIELEKKIKQLDNINFKRGQSAQTVRMLTNSKRGYDHSSKQAIGFEKPFCLKKRIVVPDSDETLELSEKSRSKMLLKAQDPLMVKNKINTRPINYDILNNDYYKRFVRQTDLYSEHAYWKETSVPPLDPSHSSTTVIVEVPKELLS